jgi:hypothetical protein
MKYPLACLQRLFELYGADLAFAYDIACAFMKTVAASSLGAKALLFRLRGVVPAFHGHSHNRGCQVHWHPMYIDGVGTEDFEECERTFKSSNELAPVTRLATPFHRWQQIMEHFDFHDLDKHASSGNVSDFDGDHCFNICNAGNFLYQNYRHALKRIREDNPKLEALSAQLKANAADYEAYLDSEREYLKSLKTEPEDVLRTVKYMESLSKLQRLQYVSCSSLQLSYLTVSLVLNPRRQRKTSVILTMVS